AQFLPARGARRHGNRELCAVERRHIDLRAKYCFRNADGYVKENVVPLALEVWMRSGLHFQEHIHSAGRFCGHAKFLPVFDTGGHAHINLASADFNRDVAAGCGDFERNGDFTFERFGLPARTTAAFASRAAAEEIVEVYAAGRAARSAAEEVEESLRGFRVE